MQNSNYSNLAGTNLDCSIVYLDLLKIQFLLYCKNGFSTVSKKLL